MGEIKHLQEIIVARRSGIKTDGGDWYSNGIRRNELNWVIKQIDTLSSVNASLRKKGSKRGA